MALGEGPSMAIYMPISFVFSSSGMSCGFRLEVQAVIQVRCVVLEALWVRNMSLDVSSGCGVHRNHPGRRRGRGRVPLLKQNRLLGPPRHVV